MADREVTSVSTEGNVTKSRIGEFELTVDADEEAGPEPNGVLLGDYASCYVPALRVGARQRGHGDLGRVRIDVEADVDDGDLAAVRFHVAVAAALDDDALDEVVARADDLCHVRTALRPELRADVTAEGDAF